MPAKFTVFKDKGNQFRFNLKAANGEIIAVGSESYPDIKSALKGIASIAKNVSTAKIVDNTVEKETSKKPAAKSAEVKTRKKSTDKTKTTSAKSKTKTPAEKRKKAEKVPRAKKAK